MALSGCNIARSVNTRFIPFYISRRFRTIFALSSGQARAAIAVIRVSGPKASSVLETMTKWRRRDQPAGFLFYTPVHHPLRMELLDKAMAVWFPGPRTFTGEDSCELHVHGGPSVVTDILEAISHVDDCFPAEPGEFTKRAFFNGKLDLTGVEGLADLLRAETSAQRKLALRQADGELKRLYGNWRQRLLKCLAHVEAFVDFAEDAHLEDAVLAEARHQVDSLLMEMWQHSSDCRVAERLRDGVRIAIVGEPNVGKSSLLNRICRRPAAIVTPIAGTTRDTLDVTLNLAGYPIVLTDTAGLRRTEDTVEREGVRRAKEKLKHADVLLVVVDASRISWSTDISIGGRVENIVQETVSAGCEDENDKEKMERTDTETLLVLNKVDLVEWLPEIGSFPIPTIGTSCLNGNGLDQLMETLAEIVKKMCIAAEIAEFIPVTQTRHRALVKLAINALEEFLDHSSRGGTDLVIAAEFLREAMHALGKITGEEVSTDEMLDVLFRDFCIGK